MKKEDEKIICENPELTREKEEKDIQDGKRNETLIDKGVLPVGSSAWLKF